jgi:O-antigen biosynthesis protein
MSDPHQQPSPYGERYYREYGPVSYSPEEQVWKDFFNGIADRLILALNPHRVLDAGCALGILVQAFWDRGVECFGIDISEYAIAHVRRDMTPYCRVASLTEPLPDRFDLIVCMEVLEHLEPDDAKRAIANLTAATDTIFFSSTPSELREPTHVNVLPVPVWLNLFAEHGFYPDIHFDASFAAPHAILFRRQPTAPPPEIATVFTQLIAQRIRAHEASLRIAELEKNAAAVEAKAQAAERELQVSAQTNAELGAELRQLRAFQSQSNLALAHLREEVERSHRRINQIYDSRIWRTLVRAGGLVERVLGRKAVAPARFTTRKQPEDAPTDTCRAHESFPGDLMHLEIDTPRSGSLVPAGPVLTVDGWAIAESGLDRIDIWIDNDGPHEATCGLMREDIRHKYPSIADSEHAGFSAFRSTSPIGPGRHTVRVRAASRAGHTVEASTAFDLDSRTLYELWADIHTPTRTDLDRLRRECQSLAHKPKISIVTPVYRTPEKFLERCAQSVMGQVYGNWEWILVDDASRDARLSSQLDGYARDPRIQVHRLSANEGIAGATNAALAKCTGDFVAFLDHDDEISPDALYHIVRTLNTSPNTDILYSDEDKLGPDGGRCDGFFKPDWSPDLLHSMNYVCHFLVCRRDLLERVGGLRTGFDGSQDYDLILRLSEQTCKVRRIPEVLYHWRIHPGSTAMSTDQKPKASDAGLRALQDHLRRTGRPATVEEVGVCRYRVRYGIEGKPEVAIIIPTGGNQKLRTALASVLDKSTYRNFRIVVIDNSSAGNVKSWVDGYRTHGAPIDWIDCRRMPFNFSALCNHGAEQVDSGYLLFLNDDTEVISPDWIESMLEHAQRPEVGAVGAQLLFPNETIQHAGVVVGIVGVAAHAFRGLDASVPRYFALPQSIRNCSAVTGACLLSRREVFERVGRFDEQNLPTCFQDVDLCLKMVDAGLNVVYTPYARLYHYESATKQTIALPAEVEYMHQRWDRYIRDDPFYNPNLSRRSDRYELDLTAPQT